MSHSRVLVPDSFNRPSSRSRRAECVTYKCRGRGALLSLPNGGLRQDVIHTKLFQKYIGDNVDNWFNWSKNMGLPVKSMEDLVFVYGCTLVTSWAAAAFDDNTGNAQLSLASRTLDNGGTGFIWSSIRGTVEYHDSQVNPVRFLLRSGCIYLSFTDLFSWVHRKRILHIFLKIDVFSSSVSEQNASFSGLVFNSIHYPLSSVLMTFLMKLPIATPFLITKFLLTFLMMKLPMMSFLHLMKPLFIPRHHPFLMTTTVIEVLLCN